MILPSPKELDRQCSVSIYKWIDLFSEEARHIDPDHKLSVQWFKMLTKEPADLFLDSDGRIFVYDGKHYFPYHFESSNGKLIGYKISAKASN